MARRNADFGVAIGSSITMDMKKVKESKDTVVRRSNEGVEMAQGHDELHGLRRPWSLQGPPSVRVGSELLEAKRIFIDVGARASVPPIPWLDGVDFLTNSSMMAVGHVTKHLIMVGGSYVGLEFGHMYRRLGSEVTIVEMGSRLIQRDAEDMSAAVKKLLEAEGVTVRLRAECINIAKRDDSIVVSLDCQEIAREVVGSHLLLAVGRRPNTDDLGVERAGLQVDRRGYIVVDDQLRTTVPWIWALGDCNGMGTFTHTSYNDYEIVTATLQDDDPRRVSDRIVAYALYIDPPLGRAGMTETQVRESGRKALMAKRPMSRVRRTVEKSETQGFMKVLVDAETKQILGAEILGVGGDEIIHSILDVMYARAP